MRKSAIIINTLFLLFFIACKEHPEKIERESLSRAVKQIDLSGDYQWIVVLPGAGCHGCIQDGELFMKRNIENQKIMFVLTKTSSLKIFQQKTGIRLNEHKNIYLDTENLFTISTDNNIYPCIIEVDQGEILSHSFQSPGNNAFRQIKE